MYVNIKAADGGRELRSAETCTVVLWGSQRWGRREERWETETWQSCVAIRGGGGEMRDGRWETKTWQSCEAVRSGGGEMREDRREMRGRNMAVLWGSQSWGWRDGSLVRQSEVGGGREERQKATRQVCGCSRQYNYEGLHGCWLCYVGRQYIVGGPAGIEKQAVIAPCLMCEW